jgi:hypothetical protein
MTTTPSNKFWRAVAVAARIDIATSVSVAAALLLWMAWH